MENLVKEIERLKKEKNAVILAHYYVNDDIQDIADYVGDSYYLSKVATKVSEQTICFAGVSFMGESAKILNPEKKVLLPEVTADCPMAHMADVEKIEEMRRRYDDLAVVCYINSTAELKIHADVCVTSSNALKIVKALPNKNIYFIPDENLGRYIAAQVPEKDFIFNEGFCHVHTSITKENVLKAKQAKPEIKVLSHPECKAEVLEISDFIGSTSEIIEFASKSDSEEFLICTELGVLHELKKSSPNKKFYSVGHRQFCPNMKKITMEKIVKCLTNMETEVTIEEEDRVQAFKSLNKMLELAGL